MIIVEFHFFFGYGTLPTGEVSISNLSLDRSWLRE